MPAKDVEAGRPPKPTQPVRYRRPAAELVQRAARRVVRGSRARYPSLVEFRAALLKQLRRDEPLAALGGARLRRLLVGVPGLRLTVRYTERNDRRAVTRCPVCGSPLVPIRNRTLTGDTVVLGQRCTRCDYWTHRARRIPVRYTIAQAGVDGRVAR